MITDKIMIIGAMKDVELNLILENLIDTKIYEEATCTFYEGFLFKQNVVVCHCNVGIINASIATFAGIKKYNPTSIFVIGTAGAHRDDIYREELVVATNVINLNSINFRTKTFDSSEELLKVIKNFQNNSDYKVHYGTIGSGDIWTKDAIKIKEFNTKYSTLCEEMESAAVYEIAQRYDVPVVTIRVISNNEIIGEKYDRKTGEVAQRFILDLLK